MSWIKLISPIVAPRGYELRVHVENVVIPSVKCTNESPKLGKEEVIERIRRNIKRREAVQ